MRHRFFTGVTGRRHAGSKLHREQVTALRSLFSRAHGCRYFGGVWFKAFTERGPC